MILVVGSTGYLGSEICRRLSAAGHPVRGLVRSTSAPARAAELTTLGVEIVTGDLRQPASLAQACRGVDAVITTVTSARSIQPGDSIPATDQQGQLDLVLAASRSGVRKFIYVSIPQSLEPCPLTTAKRTVEQAVSASGMDYTILCPAYFMETWLSPATGFDYPNAKATIFGDGHARSSFVSLGDVAEYAVQSLDNPAAQRALFEIGHPQALSLLEAVRLFEQAGGKAFELQFVPAQALEAQRDAATDPLQRSFAALMHQLAAGIQVDPARALQAFSIPLKSAAQYAEAALTKAML